MNAEDRFLSKLAGVIRARGRSARSSARNSSASLKPRPRRSASVDFLVQGTIYPDVIESGLGKSAVIKSHHNVGGLPKTMSISRRSSSRFACSSKTRCAALGRELGLPEYLVMRQPFPGPGLAIRVHRRHYKAKSSTRCARPTSSSATRWPKPAFDRQTEPVFRSSDLHALCRRHGRRPDVRLYARPSRRHHIRLHDRRLGKRSPYDVLDRVSVRIVNEVRGINRIVYDITSKAPRDHRVGVIPKTPETRMNTGFFARQNGS